MNAELVQRACKILAEYDEIVIEYALAGHRDTGHAAKSVVRVARSATDVLRQLVGDVQQEARAAIVLTERELQVLSGMSRGKSNVQIGRELYLSEDTIKTHARKLFRKLDARDRAHAVALAYQCGLLEVSA